MSQCGPTISYDIVYEISQKMVIKWLNMWAFPTFLAFQVLLSALCLSIVFPLNQPADRSWSTEILAKCHSTLNMFEHHCRTLNPRSINETSMHVDEMLDKQVASCSKQSKRNWVELDSGLKCLFKSLSPSLSPISISATDFVSRQTQTSIPRRPCLGIWTSTLT